MRISIILLVATAIATLIPLRPAAAQTTYTSPDGRYTVEIPAGFEPVPAEFVDPGIDAMFEAPSEIDPNASVSIALQSLGQELSRERFRREHIGDFREALPAATNFDIAALPWREYSVNSVSFTLATPDGSRFAAMAQVPIRENAVQVIVGAPIPESESARALLAQTVASFRGEARWALPPMSPVPPPPGRNTRASTAALILAGVIFVGGLISAFEIRRRVPRGVLFLLAIIVMAFGAARTSGDASSSDLIIGSSIRLLGFVAMFIGIADLFIPRPKKPPVARRARPGAVPTHPDQQAPPAPAVPSPPCPDDPS